MINEFLEKHEIQFEHNVALKNKTWIKTGGIAKYWIVPETLEQLSKIVKFLFDNKKKFDVIGHTSNIYFHNDYNPDFIISTIKLCKFQETPNSIICECGVNIAKLSQTMVQKGILGFYGLVNLPGTIAAAIHNNASCFGCSVSELLESIQFMSLDLGGEIVTLTSDELKFSHRSSSLKEKKLSGVILSVRLKKKAGDCEIETQKALAVTRKRRTTQEPPGKNLGSIFAKLQYRKNAKNLIAVGIKATLKSLHIKRSNYYYKKAQLLLYGFCSLDYYISNKNINTFIWKDDKANEMFEYYIQFMNRIYVNPTIEIEIRK